METGAVGREGEADRARAILVTLRDWTSVQVACALGIAPDQVRHGRDGSVSVGWTRCARQIRLLRL